MSVRAFDVGFVYPGIDQPNDTASEDEQIADLQLLDEILFDRAETSAFQENIDKALGNDCPDIHQEFAGNPGMGERNDIVFNSDFSEYACVLRRE